MHDMTGEQREPTIVGSTTRPSPGPNPGRLVESHGASSEAHQHNADLAAMARHEEEAFVSMSSHGRRRCQGAKGGTARAAQRAGGWLRAWRRPLCA